MRLTNEQLETLAGVFADKAVANMTDENQRKGIHSIVKNSFITGFITNERILKNNTDYGFKVEYADYTIYFGERTSQGFVFKDTHTSYNDHDAICYISECTFDGAEFIVIDDSRKDELIADGGISTFNSICDEVEQVVKGTDAEGDNAFIAYFAAHALDVVDWQCTQSYIYETDVDDEYKEFKASIPKSEDLL